MDYQQSADRPQDSTGVTITPAMAQAMLARAHDYLSQGNAQLARAALPPGYTLDPDSGQIREKTWWEEHGDTVKFVGLAGASLAAPFVGSALGAGGGAADTLESAMNAGVNATTAAPTVAAGAGGITLSSALGKALPALADITTKAAGSDVEQSNKSDALKLALQNAVQGAKRFSTSAPATRLATGERAALAQHATPAAVQWGGPGSGLRGEVPTYTGGIKSIFAANQDPTMKALSQRTLEDSLMSQLNGGPTGGNQDLSMGSAADVGEGSAAGDVLGGIGLGSSLAAALAKAGVFGKGPKPSTTIPDGV